MSKIVGQDRLSKFSRETNAEEGKTLNLKSVQENVW